MVIVTAIAVSAADAAGIPKKAISTVSRFLESDLPTTTVFTDTANTLAGGNTFQHYTNSFTASNTGLAISNPSNSFGYILTGGAITANRTLNLPVTTGTDTLATIGLTQTWTGTNTFNALTLGGQMNLASNTMISSGHVYTFPSNTGTVLLTNGSGSSLTGIVDSITGTANNVTASASTGAITLNLGQNAVTTGGSAQTVTKQLTLNKLSAASDVVDPTDNTKALGFSLSGMTTGKTLTLSSSQATSQTLNLPTTIETETLAVTPQTNFTAGNLNGNATTGPTGAAFLMQGNYATLTPKVTGNIRVEVSGWLAPAGNNAGCYIEIRYSSSNMGGNNAALAGTLAGSHLKVAGSSSSATVPFAQTVVVPGTVNTKEYVDLAAARTVSNTACTIFNVNWLLQEY